MTKTRGPIVMFEPVIPILQRSETFIISGHINPDGDCIGSVCACARLLRQIGKTVHILFHDPVPDNLCFLDVSWRLFADCQEVPVCDCMIVIDTPRPERLGDGKTFFEAHQQTIVIDHHISNSKFGSVNIVDASVSSCGELIYQLFKEMDEEISLSSAQLLYAAISTDTGSFRFANTTERTHRIIAELIKTGIDLKSLNRQLYSYVRRERILLLKRFLNNVSFSESGRIGWSFLSQKDLDECHATKDDMDGFVNYLSDIRDIDVAFFAFADTGEARIKVSLRSKDTVDVNWLANQFGGGGHPQAAGCVLRDDMNTVIHLIVDRAEQYLKDGVQ